MLINKIKFNYNIKVIDDYLAKNDYDGALSIISGCINNSELFYKLFLYLFNNYLIKTNFVSLYKNKFIWVTSFDSEDTAYLNKFLKSYLNEISNESFSIGKYEDILSECLSFLKPKDLPKTIDFNETVSKSNFYQSLLLFYSSKKYLITNTEAAFFEAPSNKYFIYPHSTLAMVHVVKNPIDIYLKHKEQNNSSQAALNYLGNFAQGDNVNKINNNIDKYVVNENKQNWNTTVKSWTDENVKNAYRGKIIKYEDLCQNTEEELISLIFHLKQSGLELDIDYNFIDKFVSENPIKKVTYEELSNQETKKILSNTEPSTLDQFNYHFDS